MTGFDWILFLRILGPVVLLFGTLSFSLGLVWDSEILLWWGVSQLAAGLLIIFVMGRKV